MGDSNTFRDFIDKQLMRAKINKPYRELLTTPKGMKVFLQSVTHPSFDEVNNYQTLEFIGDGLIKGVLSQYIPRRFPELAAGTTEFSKKTGEGVLSKTRRFLEQRKTLSDFGLKLGFWDHVRADSDTKETKRKEVLEDVYEAFCGALAENIDNLILPGLGYMYVYNYTKLMLDDMEIDITSENLDDPITRLNELYKANELRNGIPLKWGDSPYMTDKLSVAKLTEKPRNGRRGQVFFHTVDKIPYVHDGQDWVPGARVGLYPISVYPFEMEYDSEGKPTNAQFIQISGVYGFPKLLGRTMDPDFAKIPRQEIINNPGKYGAQIIGQGMSFKLKDAKKMAAKKAIDYLDRLGYSKETSKRKGDTRGSNPSDRGGSRGGRGGFRGRGGGYVSRSYPKVSSDKRGALEVESEPEIKLGRSNFRGRGGYGGRGGYQRR